MRRARETGSEMTKWSRWATVVAVLAIAPPPVGAHTGHGASAWLRSAHWGDRALRLVVDVLNEGGGAVTLRGVSASGARQVVFTRQRRVLGLDMEQAVEFLRLDPNELARLGEGRYRLDLVGVDPAAAELRLTLDFGPDGAVPVTVPVPPR